jgi:hypothetical protein
LVLWVVSLLSCFKIAMLFSETTTIDQWQVSKPLEKHTVQVQVQVQVANITKHPPTLYHCYSRSGDQMSMMSMLSTVLPEYVRMDLSKRIGNKRFTGKDWEKWSKQPSNPYDVFLLRMHAADQCPPWVYYWLLHVYQGKLVEMTGEDVSIPVEKSLLKDSMYLLGPVLETNDDDHHRMRLYHLQIIFWDLFHLATPDNRFHYERSSQFLLDPLQKPRNSQKHFLMYANANCVPFRQQAYDELSQLGQVHHGGKCHGSTLPSNNKTKIDSHVSLGNWGDNVLVYHDYRFCLVMEHGLVEGYVTEKILLAFAGGCVPIYYGPTSIFDLFHPDAFIFYNISNPQPALEKIRYLERNRTAYDWVMDQPILRDGNQTIETYFSFSDTVGSGKLKQRIRSKLELDQFQFVS